MTATPPPTAASHALPPPTARQRLPSCVAASKAAARETPRRGSSRGAASFGVGREVPRAPCRWAAAASASDGTPRSSSTPPSCPSKPPPRRKTESRGGSLEGKAKARRRGVEAEIEEERGEASGGGASCVAKGVEG
ncbi:hypothetical protein AB1Y20_007209 [Prymnesium parvum]|uniref:Uncharacterized protein n=1 Tax=Prymnesium parvum TaxID=97485 RepID=A0AB34IXZ6_PRYPA